MFPWHARPQQKAYVLNWMHCLPGYARVLMQLRLEWSDWFNVWFKYYMLKSNRWWCLLNVIMSSQYIQYIKGPYIQNAGSPHPPNLICPTVGLGGGWEPPHLW